jgi:hypothetical protein
LSIVAPLAVLDLVPFKDRFGNLADASRSRPDDCDDRSRSIQPRLFDCGLLLQIYQERLGPAAAAYLRRGSAHQGHVVESDGFVVHTKNASVKVIRLQAF